MQRPNVDDDLTLMTDFGKTEAICIDVLDNPATEEGVLLRVMARGPFEQGQQVLDCGSRRIKSWRDRRECLRANHRQRSNALDYFAGLAVAAGGGRGSRRRRLRLQIAAFQKVCSGAFHFLERASDVAGLKLNATAAVDDHIGVQSEVPRVERAVFDAVIQR